MGKGTTSARNLKNAFHKFFKLMGIDSTGNIFKDVMQLEQIDPEMVSENLLYYFFKNYDKDSNGFIDKDEIKQLVLDVVDALGTDIGDNELERAMKEIGLKKGDNLNLENFLRLCSELKIFERGVNDLKQNLTTNKSSVSYTSVMRKNFEPVLSLLSIPPSGNIYKDLLLLLDTLAQDKMKDILFEKFVKYFFSVYDKDNSGYIDVSELRAVMKDLNDVIEEEAKIDEAQVDNAIAKLMNEIDVDKNGSIDLEEFMAFFQNITQ